MTDKPHTPEPTEPLSRSQPSVLELSAQPIGKKSKINFAFFALFLAVLAFIESGFFVYKMFFLEKKIQVQQQFQTNQIKQLQIKQEMLKQFLLQRQSEITILNEKINSFQQAYVHLMSRSSNFNISLTLNQIEQLLQLAQFKLKYNTDINTSIFLLQKADENISSLNNASFLPLRQNIANVILQLKLLQQFDTISVLSRLNALNEKTQSLPLLITDFYEQGNKKNASILKKLNWEEKLKASLEPLKDLIIIRHRESPYVPLLPPAQQQALLQTLTQLLNQTAWAILQNNAVLYHWSLNSALMLLHNHFPVSSPVVLGMTEEMQALNALNPIIKTPDLQMLLNEFEQQKSKMQTGL